MGTHQTLADFDTSKQEEVEFFEAEESYRSAWAGILQHASADGASDVDYCLDWSDSCLIVDIGEETFPMVPPPVEYRKQMLAAGRRFAIGSKWKALLHRVASIFRYSPLLGTITVETKQGDVFWRVYEMPNGLSFERVEKES
jgi:hypothetical protein